MPLRLQVLPIVFAMSLVACGASPAHERADVPVPHSEATTSESTSLADPNPNPTEVFQPAHDEADAAPGAESEASGALLGEATDEALGEFVIDGQTLEVDGLVVHDLHCEGAELQGWALVELVSQLSEQKGELDACAAGGAAYRLRLQWSEGLRVGALAPTTDDASTCVREVLERVALSGAGSCELTLLVGEAEAAEAAAAALRAN